MKVRLMCKLAMVAMPFMLAASPVSAAATLLDFETVAAVPAGPGVSLFSSYGGLAWSGPDSGWAIVDPAIECFRFSCGFRNAMTSATHVATNGFDGTGIISNATPWVAVSLQLGSAWYNGLQVAFAGYNGATLVWSDSFSVNATGSTLISFNSAQITELRVHATLTPNSTRFYAAGSGPRMVWDDFRVDLAPAVGAVPEPASWAMMIFGFGLVGNAMRRRSLVRMSTTA